MKLNLNFYWSCDDLMAVEILTKSPLWTAVSFFILWSYILDNSLQIQYSNNNILNLPF